MRQVMGALLLAAALCLNAPAIAADAAPIAPIAPAAPAAPTAPVAASAAITPPEHVRGVEQTFLTYPEWFLVFSPAEYARFVAHASPDAFPFIGHVGQFWRSYAAVTAEQRRRGDALNPGYHVMILVIGTSTSVEYGLRAVYEGLIGRLAEALCSGCRTPEDEHAARAAQAYVDFIRVLPWYQFDFMAQLRGLWRDVPMTGPHLLRKWERRWALSTEYLVKAAYGRLIGWATHAAYDAPLLETAVVVSPAPRPAPDLADLKVLRVLPDGAVLATVPRYDAFTRYARALAAQQLSFREIAGNDTVMLVSLLGRQDWRPTTGIEHVLFEQPILTEPGRKRVVATVHVRGLGDALREWSQAGIEVEHLFDY